MASLDLDELETLALQGGYTGIAALSSFSAVMLLSACRAFLHDTSLWTGAGYELTEDEIDDIDELVSQAEYELMLSTVGMIMPYAGSTIPTWALLCDGTQYQRVDYPEVYAVLDSAFIVDADTFATPNLRDRMIIGVSTFTAPGDTGGADSHTLATGQLPAHSHTVDAHGHSYLAPVSAPTLIGAGAPAPNIVSGVPATTGLASPGTSSVGSGDSIDHRNKHLVLSYILVVGN